MTVDRLVNALVTVTLIEMIVATGLSVTFVELRRVARNRPLMARAALANHVCVPAAAVGLLLLFNAQTTASWSSCRRTSRWAKTKST